MNLENNSHHHIKALDGKLFALCTDGETELVMAYIEQGKKYGIHVTVGGKKPENQLDIVMIKNTTNATVSVEFEAE